MRFLSQKATWSPYYRSPICWDPQQISGCFRLIFVHKCFCIKIILVYAWKTNAEFSPYNEHLEIAKQRFECIQRHFREESSSSFWHFSSALTSTNIVNKDHDLLKNIFNILAEKCDNAYVTWLRFHRCFSYNNDNFYWLLSWTEIIIKTVDRLERR